MKKITHRLIAILLMLSMLTLGLTLNAQDEQISCTSFPDSPTAERVTYYMGEGAGFLAGRQYSQAVRSYTCAIQLDGSFIGAYNQRAVAYTMQQDYEQAIEDYDAVLEMDSSSRAALNNRGIAYAALRDYDTALSDFDTAIELDDSYVNAYLNRGVIRAINSEFEGAIEDVQQAIDISGIEDIVTTLKDPNRESTPQYDRDNAQMYAILGIIYSGFALENYNDYLLLRGGNADQRIQSAAGSLQSRFEFDLRLDDGTWLLMADFNVAGEEE